jgi:glutathione synthase/RimK-type ligase-like ATP-grasp enzyme
MKYFLDSEIFSSHIKKILKKRANDWVETKNAKDSFLCISEGPNAESYLNKTKCKSDISFTTNYETSIINYMRSKGLLAIKDKSKTSKLFTGEKFIVATDNFFYKNKSTMSKFIKNNKDIKKFVVKPSYFSHSNEGVLVTESVDEAKKHVKNYGLKFPQWIIQEYVQSKTSIPHYLKVDLFLVKNTITKNVELYFSNKIMYYGARDTQNIEKVRNFSATKKLLKNNRNVKITGKNHIDAKKKFNSIYGYNFFDTKLIPQLNDMCLKILNRLEYKDIKCFSKNLICCQYMSMDMILNSNDTLKLIEVNVVPTHHFKSNFKLQKNSLGKKLNKIYPDFGHRNYVSHLLNDMLTVTLDSIVAPDNRQKLKFLHKAE